MTGDDDRRRPQAKSRDRCHATEGDGTTTWVLDIERVEPAVVPMAIVSA